MTARVSMRKYIFTAIIVCCIGIASWLTVSRASAKLDGARTAKNAAVPLNYDIRLDKAASATVAAYRTAANRSEMTIADERARIGDAEERLRIQVPTLKIENNRELGVPEVIATDVAKGRAFLTSASRADRIERLKGFLDQNRELIGARPSDIAELKTSANYTNPDGKLSFAQLSQEIDGIPVFRGEIKAGFAPSGEIIRVINNFAPGLDRAAVSSDFGDPAEALRLATIYAGTTELRSDRLAVDKSRSTDTKIVFGTGDFVPTAEKTYFPTEPGVAVAAWRVVVPLRSQSFYVVVDAVNGTLLWRKDLTDHQTQSASYRIYGNPDAMINVAENPFPLSPAPTSPNGVQGNAIPRTLVTRVGNESPYQFNNLGWISDGNNTLDGNNVQAGLDREAPNDGSLDANAIDPLSIPAGSPNRVFDFPIDPAVPANPSNGLGESPLPDGQTPQVCLGEGTNAVPTNFQKAVTTQLFYVSNVFHDEAYRLGFTEAAGNFQNDNFGRGGLGSDRISAQAQDCSGVNNANFTTPPDGQRPQMQMYIWQKPQPPFVDGSLDNDVVIHELAHGLSNRLHGNSTGLMLDIARGMGEGWSDFFAHCMLSSPTDPLDGVYTIGSYDTYLYQTVGFNNYYYGIRRYPTALMSSVGGPMNRPHNPLTFQDIDSTKSDITDGAFNPRFNVTADQVHAIGEVWASALWEIRARMIQRLGWEEGNRRILQFVVDGMKLAPLGPTPISERDAMIAAIFASGTAEDLEDAWAGFAVRGIGAGASVDVLGGISLGGTGQVRVTESFDLPNISQTPAVTVADTDGDGYPEPGESVFLTIPLANSTGRTATGVTAAVVGGGTADYGTLSGLSAAARTVAYTIPASAECNSVVSVTINVDSSLGPIAFTRSIFLGRPTATIPGENFDSSTALPANWTAVAIDGGINFVNSTSTPDSAPNVMYARNPTTVGGGTNLTSPPISVTSPAATVSFRNSYRTENGWDGGVLEISIAGGEWQDIAIAGGVFLENGYNGQLGGGRNNPIASRPGWTGNSNGYLTTVVQLPSAANGRIVRLRWRFGADDNTAGSGTDPGWRVDTISFVGAGIVTAFECTVNTTPATISGRVLTPSGLSVRNAVVTLTEPDNSQTRVTTGSFGLFSFDNVALGSTVIVSVSSKRYRFTPRTLNITGNVSGLDLIGLE